MILNSISLMRFKTKLEARRHVVMSVFSMTQDSGFSIELVSYVVGIKEATVVKILSVCREEYLSYVNVIYKKHRL